MAEAVQLTISHTFTESVAKLPDRIASKAWLFLRDFPRDPRSPSFQLEKLHAKGMHSARLTGSHRVILSLHGPTAVVLWADEHQPAYRWAKQHQLRISPRNGLQLVRIDLEEQRRKLEKRRRTTEPGRLFLRWTDDELRQVGVENHQLPLVRWLDSEDDFVELCPHLPQALAEGLLELLCPPEAVAEDVAPQIVPAELEETSAIPQEVLDHPETRRAFYVAENEEDLQRVLREPLAVWRIFLHPAQERVVKADLKGPGWVTGGAGTGKTVVALHRARHLARHVFTEPAQRILVTTFSRTLADNLSRLVEGLCGPEGERIECINLHRWCMRELSRVGERPDIATPTTCERVLEEVLQESEADFPVDFMQEEIRDIIETQDVQSFAEYARAQRTGKGRRLSRTDRKLIWEIVETYRRRMEARRQCDFLGMVRRTRVLVQVGRIKNPYAAVIVDEAQDFHAQELRLLHALAPRPENSLLIVGDGRQRIYPGGYSLSQLGIKVDGRVFVLKRNYRNTAEILQAAEAVMRDADASDLDGGIERSQSITLYHGPQPKLHLEPDIGAAVSRTCELVEQLCEGNSESATIEPNEIAIFAVANATLENSLAPALQERGIDVQFLKDDREEDNDGVCLGTMHRAKGLEFKACIVFGVGRDEYPPSFIRRIEDEQWRREETERYRRVLHVAMGRARDVLLLVGQGEDPSGMVDEGLVQRVLG